MISYSQLKLNPTVEDPNVPPAAALFARCSHSCCLHDRLVRAVACSQRECVYFRHGHAGRPAGRSRASDRYRQQSDCQNDDGRTRALRFSAACAWHLRDRGEVRRPPGSGPRRPERRRRGGWAHARTAQRDRLSRGDLGRILDGDLERQRQQRDAESHAAYGDAVQQ